MTVISWLLLISIQNRNTFILSGEDNLVILLTFWAMFLPLGAVYSVDSALDRANNGGRRSYAYWSVASTALLIQGMSMYLFSAILKTHPVWVPDGTAVYYALQLDYIVKPLALWFRQFESVMQGLTYYVYALELIGPILIFSPILHRSARTLFMVLFMTMHMGFFLFLEIGLFPLISIIMNLTFMPSWMWDRLGRAFKLGEATDVMIWYDQDCGFCLKMCRLLKTFLFLTSTPIAPAQSDAKIFDSMETFNSWVITRGSEHHLKFDAFVCLVEASPVYGRLSILLRPSLVGKLGQRMYEFVAHHRTVFSRLSAPILIWKPVRADMNWIGQGLAALFLIFISVQNISTIPAAGLSLPYSFVQVRQALGLYQNWTMFAPHPEMTSPWIVVEGRLETGGHVNAYTGSPVPPVAAKPEYVSKTYANYRWRKFLSNMEDQSYEPVDQFLARGYGDYLCRNWNVGHEEMNALASVQIGFGAELTGPPGSGKQTGFKSIWTHNCF